MVTRWFCPLLDGGLAQCSLSNSSPNIQLSYFLQREAASCFSAVLYSLIHVLFCYNTSAQLYRASLLLFAVSPQQHRQGIDDCEYSRCQPEGQGMGRGPLDLDMQDICFETACQVSLLCSTGCVVLCREPLHPISVSQSGAIRLAGNSPAHWLLAGGAQSYLGVQIPV